MGSLNFPSKKRGRGVFKMKRIQYNPKLKEAARHLRNNSTKTEIKLWIKKHTPLNPLLIEGK